MDVLKLLDNLELENKKSCNDAFQFFMSRVIEDISFATFVVAEELIKDPPDPALIISALFKHRNIVSMGIKLKEFAPLSAFHEYAYFAEIKINDNEFIYGHTLLAFICAKLALRHHARGHGAKAAMYAIEALDCIKFIHYWLPKKDVYQDGLARSELARNAARQRHTKTHALRNEVVDYWKANVPPNISNEDAGFWLKDTFPDLSSRKLSEYVSRAKKEMTDLPPTGKA